jgi:hypothetical protein
VTSPRDAANAAARPGCDPERGITDSDFQPIHERPADPQDTPRPEGRSAHPEADEIAIRCRSGDALSPGLSGQRYAQHPLSAKAPHLGGEFGRHLLAINCNH